MIRLGVPESIDIIVKRSKPIACPNRLRYRQVIAREQERGPVSLRLQLLVYRASERQNRLVERSYTIQCRTPIAVKAVRQQIRRLMDTLNEATVVDVPSA